MSLAAAPLFLAKHTRAGNGIRYQDSGAVVVIHSWNKKITYTRFILFPLCATLSLHCAIQDQFDILRCERIERSVSFTRKVFVSFSTKVDGDGSGWQGVVH
jgi:hypothetical protein